MNENRKTWVAVVASMAGTLAAAFGLSVLVKGCNPQNEYQTDTTTYLKDRDVAKVVFEKKVGDHGAYKETLVRELVVPFSNGTVDPDKLCISLSYEVKGDIASFNKTSPLAQEYAGSVNPGLRATIDKNYGRLDGDNRFQNNLECGSHLETDFSGELKKAIELRNLSNGIKPVRPNFAD